MAYGGLQGPAGACGGWRWPVVACGGLQGPVGAGGGLRGPAVACGGLIKVKDVFPAPLTPLRG